MRKNEVKINKDELLSRAAARLNAELPPEHARVSEEDLRMYYDAIETEIKIAVIGGARVSFTGFGSYYACLHRGHPVQFGGGSERVPDYRVFKFSASNVLNKILRAAAAPVASLRDA